MGEQQSKKRGMKSSAQKEYRARNAYEEIPASNRVGGAFGKTNRRKASDRDVALATEKRSAKRPRQGP